MTKNLLHLEKDEINLLLFFETCAVDMGGKIDNRCINELDVKIADKWRDEGFINWGRIKFKSITSYKGKKLTNWVFLSDEAWVLAGEARKLRGLRNFKNKENGFINVMAD